METVSQTGDIQVGSDLAFERRWWRLEWVCWAVMLALVVAGLTGVFGRGPLSKATAELPGGGLQVRYERLARMHAPAVLELRLGKRAVQSGRVEVRLGGDLPARLRVQQIVPRPLAAEVLPDGARFVFRTDPSADSATIRFIQQPVAFGPAAGEVTLEGESPVRFRQFVYP